MGAVLSWYSKCNMKYKSVIVHLENQNRPPCPLGPFLPLSLKATLDTVGPSTKNLGRV